MKIKKDPVTGRNVIDMDKPAAGGEQAAAPKAAKVKPAHSPKKRAAAPAPKPPKAEKPPEPVAAPKPMKARLAPEVTEYKSGRMRPTLQIALFDQKWRGLTQMVKDKGYTGPSALAEELLDGWVAKHGGLKAPRPNGKADL